MPGLTKRPKLSSTPPLSALGRLAEAAVAEKRAISPSIKEPSVVPIEGKDGLWTSPSPCVVRAPGFRKAPSRLSSVGSLENGEQESAVSLFFRACLLGPPSPHLCFRLSVTRGAYVTQGRVACVDLGPEGAAAACAPLWPSLGSRQPCRGLRHWKALYGFLLAQLRGWSRREPDALLEGCLLLSSGNRLTLLFPCWSGVFSEAAFVTVF